MSDFALQKQGTSHALKLVAFLYTVIIAMMITGLKGIVNYASFGLLILILLVYYLGAKKGKVRITKAVTCFFFFILFYIVTSLPKLNADYFATYTCYYILSFSPIIICQSLIESQDDALIKKSLKWCLVAWFAMAFISISFYITHPSAARLLAVNREQYATSIFGGYQFAFGSALLLVYLLQFVTDRTIERKWHVLTIVGCIVLFIEILMTESTLTTFATIIGIVAWLFFDNKDRSGRKKSHLIIGVTLLLIIVAFLYSYVENNLSSISSWLASRSDVVMSRRLTEIINKMFYSETSGHYQRRTDALVTSLELFTQRPLFGWGVKYGNVFSEGIHYGIGNHSELFDSLAKYGMVGSIPLFGVFFYSMRDYCRKRISLLFTFGMLVLFNPLSYFQSHLPIFYIIPLFEYLLNQRDN